MPVTLALLLALQQPCPAGAEPVPPALAAWGPGREVEVAATPQGVPELMIGQPAELTLQAAASLSLPLAPGRAAPAGSHGGIAAFAVATAGRYRIALSTPGWIDVVAAGRNVASVGHGHGPRCSGMRKIVDFELPAGRYLLQVSGNPVPAARAMIVAAQ